MLPLFALPRHCCGLQVVEDGVLLSMALFHFLVRINFISDSTVCGHWCAVSFRMFASQLDSTIPPGRRRGVGQVDSEDGRRGRIGGAHQGRRAEDLGYLGRVARACAAASVWRRCRIAARKAARQSLSVMRRAFACRCADWDGFGPAPPGVFESGGVFGARAGRAALEFQTMSVWQHVLFPVMACFCAWTGAGRPKLVA